MRLEYKSQSAARRLLNSAARLAHEFAKPDRFNSQSLKSPTLFSKTMPRAMSRETTGKISPLLRTATRRGKSPKREHGSTGGIDIKSGATL